MNPKKIDSYQVDILSEKVELPSFSEIRKIESRCEREHDDAIWSVISAPFKALRGLLDYSGQANQQIVGTV